MFVFFQSKNYFNLSQLYHCLCDQVFESYTDALKTGYCLIYSCYTRERCRFGRGCIFAHSNEELKEWMQEYVRKEREKLSKELQDKAELDSMEMISKILKGPAEDVSEFNFDFLFVRIYNALNLYI